MLAVPGRSRFAHEFHVAQRIDAAGHGAAVDAKSNAKSNARTVTGWCEPKSDDALAHAVGKCGRRTFNVL